VQYNKTIKYLQLSIFDRKVYKSDPTIIHISGFVFVNFNFIIK